MAASPESYPVCDPKIQADSQSEAPDAETIVNLASSTTIAASAADVLTADALNETSSTQMDKQLQQQQQSNHFPIDEIPEPIKVLDDIISEFEDSSKPAVGNGENQSEDDGYMSLSRKNMHKRGAGEMTHTCSVNSSAPLEAPNTCFREYDTTALHNGGCTLENANKSTKVSADQIIIQTTLPKIRPTAAINTNYSSLPCCGVQSGSKENKMRAGSCNGERNALGIDISAVHNAVLRGGLAKLPEPILNEHPVTIYPGRYSPPSDGVRGSRPQRLISSVEKHKEVCQILNPLSSISSSSSSSTPSTGSSDNKKRILLTNDHIDKSCKSLAGKVNRFRSASEDELSEDSVEEQSLSPLGSTHLPNKQTAIAWEIHFDRNQKKSKPTSEKKHLKKIVNANSETAFFISGSGSLKAIKPIVNDLVDFKSANDLCLNEDVDEHSSSPSSEDPETSSHSPTDKLNYCMYRHTNMLGKGTFIIRRSTKKHPKAVDIFQGLGTECESPNDCETSDLSSIESNDIYKQTPPNLISNPRHSFELGVSQCTTSLTSPRDRLSLNIESQHQYSLNKDVSVKQIGANSLLEGVAKSLDKVHAKPIESQRSTESVNEKAPCLEEELADDIKTSNTNSFERFPYKNNNNSSNGLKNPDYTELRSSNTTTPHTDLAPTLEEDEEQYSDFSYGCAPLQQIESNISALLRGDIAVVRIGDTQHTKRSLEFRPGVHKSESAKEMLLSQNALGPLPPSPPSSNPDLFDYDAHLPPLPPSPSEISVDDDLPQPYMKTTSAEIHAQATGDEIRSRDNACALRHLTDDLPLPPPSSFDNLPPAVPPHRVHSVNTIKSWSIDSNYKKKSPKMLGYGSGITTPTGPNGPPCEAGAYSTKRFAAYGTKRSLKQSPREEHRLQTSCSLPETPIFARGCDIPRTPFRRQNENTVSGSRTAPRSSTSHSINMGTSIVGISGGNTFGTGMCRQRSINHALASNEMLRLSGVPARGWYPKQRSMRPVSTENIDRLTSIRVWESAAGMSSTGQARKPLTLPPNLTPSFLNKSPREALRRVTSLLITKKKNTKDRKNKAFNENTIEKANINYEMDTSSSAKEPIRACNNAAQKPQKKKGLFKNLWKRTKHFSLDQ